MSETILVTGAGGFIGGHLVAKLLQEGHRVRAVDKKPQSQWYQSFPAAESLTLNLEEKTRVSPPSRVAIKVYNLAADMGGMGFIELNKGLCMLTVLINTHMLMAARACGAKRFFYSSSACVYAGFKQQRPDIPGLKEEDAYPADPEDGYGWEKLFSERMCRHFREDFGLETRVARYPQRLRSPWHLRWRPREGAGGDLPKVIAAKLSGRHEIEIWGDGKQTRSFMFIDDCLYGTRALMESDIVDPINIGSSEMVTINRLVDLVEEIAGINVKRNYKLDAPKGVRGRSSDNTLIKSKLGWEPSTPLRTGLEKTYAWIFDQMKNGGFDRFYAHFDLSIRR